LNRINANLPVWQFACGPAAPHSITSSARALSRGACLLHARTAEFFAFFTVQALGIGLFRALD
jgi:hypothetical protein